MASQSAIGAASAMVLIPAAGEAGPPAALPGAGRGSIDLRVRPLYNPGLRTPTYIVPGIIGVPRSRWCGSASAARWSS
jgi:hypothetical protein